MFIKCDFILYTYSVRLISAKFFVHTNFNVDKFPFSSYLGKSTLRLDLFSEPASYNTCKGLDVCDEYL